jgi:hypothetical protein
VIFLLNPSGKKKKKENQWKKGKKETKSNDGGRGGPGWAMVSPQNKEK